VFAKNNFLLSEKFTSWNSLFTYYLLTEGRRYEHTIMYCRALIYAYCLRFVIDSKWSQKLQPCFRKKNIHSSFVNVSLQTLNSSVVKLAKQVMLCNFLMICIIQTFRNILSIFRCRFISIAWPVAMMIKLVKKTIVNYKIKNKIYILANHKLDSYHLTLDLFLLMCIK
jgi:hypothetical protein